MLYNLLYPLGTEYIVFNVFRYITFRSVWALVTALLIGILIGPRFIGWLRRIKCGQQIHEDVKAHQGAVNCFQRYHQRSIVGRSP